MKKVQLYDTTLRDGTQSQEVSLSVLDKLKVAEKLDEFGIHYIEGGYPGSNPKDKEFFELARKIRWKNSVMCAFGMTRRVGKKVEEDSMIRVILAAGTPVVTVVGKSWDFHVIEALRTTLEENLHAVKETIAYLKRHAGTVFFDAEHFFDGYKNNPKYTMKVISAAADAGADCLVLCDTNGGSMPSEVSQIVREVRKATRVPLGIHTHNDGEMAVANTLAAVEQGATQVQGTINGYGERCGNANLCSIIPALQLKMGQEVLPKGQMRKLYSLSRFVAEAANMKHWLHQPYVGDAAFAHKGGMHVSAIRRHPKTYEHLEPEVVGNQRHVLISDLAGRSNILSKIQERGLKFNTKDPNTEKILDEIKELEHKGYQFEGADASFELLARRALGEHEPFFELKGFRVIDEKRSEGEAPIAEATIMIAVDGKVEHTAALGNGPVNAMDNALRKALEKFYPEVSEVQLLDYKVRVIQQTGTGSSVRVLIQSGDKESNWGTVGVSHNIIEASWQALVDSIRFKLWRTRRGQPGESGS
ncbi:MAG: citramalate synthase [Deltaproteobacteria bacterium]|nr:MAG: citramalate synthase [Deltaproteobacteria bacterium]